MIKLIASDLDGTLLHNGAQQLPEELFALIRQLNEMGIRFVAASGRQYANMKRMFGPVADQISYICENGAIAIADEKDLYQDAFDKEILLDIVKTIQEKEGAEFCCSARDFHYMMPKTEHFRDLMENVVKNNCKEIQSFEEITESCMKAAVYERTGVTEESIQYWKSRFGDRCTVVTSGFAWVDFIPFGTNKAQGVKKFQELLGISPEECMVFGDEYNDIEMLESVKYSFAMAHSKPRVQEAANYTAQRVETILEKLIAAGGNIEEVI